MKLSKLLRNYDRLLIYKKNNNGTIDIIRKSPFNKNKEHKILSLNNSYIGSGNWIIRKIISMDTTRYDLVGNAMRYNWALRKKRNKDNMHREIADFMLRDGSTFVN